VSIKLLLVDNHKIMREGLRSLVETKSDMQVVGEAGNGQEAVQLARQLQPDVVVMDARLPQMDGIKATRQITRDNTEIKVLGLSVYTHKQYVLGMLKAGARGYVLKDYAFGELINAIKTVMKNETYLSEKLNQLYPPETLNRIELDRKVLPPLTERETKVLKLISQGKSTKEIALKVKKSPKTIDACRRQIMIKLNIDNIADLVKFAIREGLSSLDD